MRTEDGTLYMIPRAAAEEDDWAAPAPAGDVIRDAVVAAGDLTAEDVGDLSSYVDVSALRGVVDGDDDEIAFSVEGHEVVVSGDGAVDVTVT